MSGWGDRSFGPKVRELRAGNTIKKERGGIAWGDFKKQELNRRATPGSASAGIRRNERGGKKLLSLARKAHIQGPEIDKGGRKENVGEKFKFEEGFQSMATAAVNQR